MKDYSVYPGEYVPPEDTLAAIQQLRNVQQIPFAKPAVNMEEYDHDYKIEIGVPGAVRGEITVDIDDGVLSVYVLKKEKCNDAGRSVRIHEFEKNRMERQIILPDDADTEFIIAEYREGLLSVCVPKTSMPGRRHNHVVVY